MPAIRPLLLLLCLGGCAGREVPGSFAHWWHYGDPSGPPRARATGYGGGVSVPDTRPLYGYKHTYVPTGRNAPGRCC